MKRKTIAAIVIIVLLCLFFAFYVLVFQLNISIFGVQTANPTATPTPTVSPTATSSPTAAPSASPTVNPANTQVPAPTFTLALYNTTDENGFFTHVYVNITITNDGVAKHYEIFYAPHNDTSSWSRATNDLEASTTQYTTTSVSMTWNGEYDFQVRESDASGADNGNFSDWTTQTITVTGSSFS